MTKFEQVNSGWAQFKSWMNDIYVIAWTCRGWKLIKKSTHESMGIFVDAKGAMRHAGRIENRKAENTAIGI